MKIVWRQEKGTTSDSLKRGGQLRLDLSFLIGRQGSPLVGTRQNLTSDKCRRMFQLTTPIVLVHYSGTCFNLLFAVIICRRIIRRIIV
jgi:hypothetical protein